MISDRHQTTHRESTYWQALLYEQVPAKIRKKPFRIFGFWISQPPRGLKILWWTFSSISMYILEITIFLSFSEILTEILAK